MRKRDSLRWVVIVLIVLAGLMGKGVAGEPSSQSAGLFPFKSPVNGLFGYIDVTGQVKIPPLFNAVCPFAQGLAAVEKRDVARGWGYIDPSGRWAVRPDFATRWFLRLAPGSRVGTSAEEARREHVQGLAATHDFGVWFNGKCLGFSEGLSLAQESLFGFIDRSGRFVIPPRFRGADGFSEDRAAVTLDGERFGYIDKTGQVVIASQFQEGGQFVDGLAPIAVGGRFGFIDKSGRVKIVPQFEVADRFAEGLAAVKISAAGKGRYGFLDRSGQIAIPARFEAASRFSTGLAPVRTDTKWGYIDRSGREIIAPRFAWAAPFVGDLALVMIERGRGFGRAESGSTYVVTVFAYIDRAGQTVFEWSDIVEADIGAAIGESRQRFIGQLTIDSDPRGAALYVVPMIDVDRQPGLLADARRLRNYILPEGSKTRLQASVYAQRYKVVVQLGERVEMRDVSVLGGENREVNVSFR